MAERAGAGSSTSLRGMRERMVAAATAIAEERRNMSGHTSLPSQSSSTRSTVKPVIDGSVLKNDMRQRLAKERREEKRRQEDAVKESQLLEKQRKAKLQYEKQIEEKQRRLKEQKEKDEQRRISAEEKRKQKLDEERERFRAVLHRTLERSNRFDNRQKRWSWEGSLSVSSESKAGNKQSVSTEKLEQETSGLHKQTSATPAGLQQSVAKKKTDKRSSSLTRRHSKQLSSTETKQVEEKPHAQRSTNVRENNLITRLLTPTKASIAKTKSTVSLTGPAKDTSGPPVAVIQVVSTPSHNLSNDDLKDAFVQPAAEKIERPSEVNPATPTEASREVLPSKVSMEALPGSSREAQFEANLEEFAGISGAEASLEASLDASLDVRPGPSSEAFPICWESSPDVSVDPSPEVSMDSSPDVSVNPSPEVSMDSSSLDSSPDLSLEASSDSMEASPKPSVETLFEADFEVLPEASAQEFEASPEAFAELSLDTSSKMKGKEPLKTSDKAKKTSNLATRKCSSSDIPGQKWSSSTSGWRQPSPSRAKQLQKNRTSSPSPMPAKQLAQSSLSYKVTPVHQTLFIPTALGAIGKKKGVSKSTSKSETTFEESGSKSTPGTLNAEEATKILTEKRRLAREQREKELERRKEKDTAHKDSEDQESEFSKSEDGQQQEELKKKKGCQDQGILLQKGDTKVKAQEEVDQRKKEHERIMLQNLKERLERKKRIEEIMKRTRKTDWSASKVAEASSKSTYEADEADDEDESESDDSDIPFSAFVNGMEISTRSKTHLKTMKKHTTKLVFLDPTSSQIQRDTNTYYNGEVIPMRHKSMKEASMSTKGTRMTTKRNTSRTKTRKASEPSVAGISKSSHSATQEWICGTAIDMTNVAEPAPSVIPPENQSQKHTWKNPMAFPQSPQSPTDKQKKSVSSQPDK